MRCSDEVDVFLDFVDGFGFLQLFALLQSLKKKVKNLLYLKACPDIFARYEHEQLSHVKSLLF